jgi:hypothetical protein
MATPGVGDRIGSTKKSCNAPVRRHKTRWIFFRCDYSSFFVEVHDLSSSFCRQVQTSVASLAGSPIEVVSIIAKPITRRRRILIQFNQFSLDKFQRQNFVYLKGIVSPTTAVSFEDLFQTIGTKVGSTARVRVNKHLP